MTDQGKKNVGIAAISLAITVVSTIAGITWAFGSAQSLTTETLRNQGVHIADHETRIRNLERTSEQVASDIRWIRQTMERRQP